MNIICLFRVLTEFSLLRILTSMSVLSKKFNLKENEKNI